jgi:hypothetical protein
LTKRPRPFPANRDGECDLELNRRRQLVAERPFDQNAWVLQHLEEQLLGVRASPLEEVRVVEPVQRVAHLRASAVKPMPERRYG